MNILMYHREQDMGFSHHHRKASGGTQKLRQTLEQQRGRIEFLTGDADGLIEICPQAYGATRLNPSRISLKVTSQSEVSDDQKVARKLLNQGPSLEEEFLVKAQGSQISQELQRMEEKVYELISNSESSKEREVDFHNQCVKLNRAVRYWPMFRILILLVAGYMQASHVIRFMKARHIH
jgi:emp24/gp25L/p24 family/GOLD